MGVSTGTSKTRLEEKRTDTKDWANTSRTGTENDEMGTDLYNFKLGGARNGRSSARTGRKACARSKALQRNRLHKTRMWNGDKVTNGTKLRMNAARVKRNIELRVRVVTPGLSVGYFSSNAGKVLPFRHQLPFVDGRMLVKTIWFYCVRLWNLSQRYFPGFVHWIEYYGLEECALRITSVF